MVERIREHVIAGDVIQTVPSQRLARPTAVHPFNIYRQLRIVDPSPYMFFLDFGEFQLVGASPELLVRVEGGEVVTHPIAGTRKRGLTPEDDERLAVELLGDEKERAEHIMLVDLGRNDVGKVSKPGTVKVPKMMEIEKYSHVMHIVSHVTGELAPGLTVFDAFRSIFPAGTVSGAPKVRAMELIAEMEPSKRGVYAGAVGYARFAGSLDTCIAIRTMVIKDGVASLQAGGGIVYDSEPEAEYFETMTKMGAVMRAIDQAEIAAAEAPNILRAAAPMGAVAP
jgi:anthranilate synthase component 1